MTTMSEPTTQFLDIQKHIEISAPIKTVWETILEQIGSLNEGVPGVPMPMTLEAWPGGRWFRDFGNNTGHLWGHVQTFRPPDLLEIQGPLFMSSPVISYVAYKLKQQGSVTLIEFCHRAVGQIPAHLSDGVAMKRGWGSQFERISAAAEGKAK